jgi:hypothetical protein
MNGLVWIELNRGKVNYCRKIQVLCCPISITSIVHRTRVKRKIRYKNAHFVKLKMIHIF